MSCQTEARPAAGDTPTEDSKQGTLALGQALVLGRPARPRRAAADLLLGPRDADPVAAGWDYDRLDSELRKAFEVALHAGTAAALLITLRDEVGDAVRGMRPRGRRADRAVVRPAGDRRLPARAPDRAAPRHAADDRRRADRSARWRWPGPTARRRRDARPDAGAVDALWLGIAQACALIPGVSRNGATLAAARLRRFTREDANRLSRHVALPVIAGATLLKSARLAGAACRPDAACRSRPAPPPRSPPRSARRG